MNCSNQSYDSISTVQLSPFGEDQWNRIVTYSPIYVHWTDFVSVPQKQTSKASLAKRNLLNSIDVNSIRLDDEILINEIRDMRRSAAMPRSVKLRESSYQEARFLDDERYRKTTSPADEYQQSSNIFQETNELSKHYPSYIESSFLNSQRSTQQQPQTNKVGRIKSLANIDFGPKPQASIGVQLRQSAITREHALATANDRRIISPSTMCSSRRTGGSAHSNRPPNPPTHSLASQTPQTVETSLHGGLYEHLSTDSSTSARKSNSRSTNTSRTTLRMIKTKNDRARQKQLIELKTILVNTCRPPVSGESDLEESIPNSIEVMRKLGGPVTAFEKTLRYNYHRQLNRFRNGSTKC